MSRGNPNRRVSPDPIRAAAAPAPLAGSEGETRTAGVIRKGKGAARAAPSGPYGEPVGYSASASALRSLERSAISFSWRGFGSSS